MVYETTYWPEEDNLYWKWDTQSNTMTDKRKNTTKSIEEYGIEKDNIIHKFQDLLIDKFDEGVPSACQVYDDAKRTLASDNTSQKVKDYLVDYCIKFNGLEDADEEETGLVSYDMGVEEIDTAHYDNPQNPVMTGKRAFTMDNRDYDEVRAIVITDDSGEIESVYYEYG